MYTMFGTAELHKHTLEAFACHLIVWQKGFALLLFL